MSSSLRRIWDAAIMLLIVVSAFEVPFHVLIGWEDPEVAHMWSWIYCVFFGIDILVHLIHGDTAAFFHDTKPPPRSQPERALHYLRSPWFVIDFLAWIPLDLIVGHFTGLHAVRTIRILRSVHILHAFKGLRAIDRLRRKLRHHPAYGRLLMTSFLVPWLIHLHTVALLWAERDQPGTDIVDYSSAGHQVLVTLLNQDFMSVQTAFGYAIWLSTTGVALLVLATVIGNAASLIMGIDRSKAEMEKRLNDWHAMFKAYPTAFDTELRHAIIRHETQRAQTQQKDLAAHVKLVESLPGELEERIMNRLQGLGAEHTDERTAELAAMLGGPEA